MLCSNREHICSGNEFSLSACRAQAQCPYLRMVEYLIRPSAVPHSMDLMKGSTFWQRMVRTGPMSLDPIQCHVFHLLEASGDFGRKLDVTADASIL